MHRNWQHTRSAKRLQLLQGRGRGECESVVCVCVRESNVCVCVCWGVFCAVWAQLSECFADFKPCALWTSKRSHALSHSATHSLYRTLSLSLSLRLSAMCLCTCSWLFGLLLLLSLSCRFSVVCFEFSFRPFVVWAWKLPQNGQIFIEEGRVEVKNSAH